MAQTKQEKLAQEDRRRQVAVFYVQRMPKGEMAERLDVSNQTITRDVKYLIDLWNKELVRDPVEQRGRTLAAMMELYREASRQYREKKSEGWWDRQLQAIQAIATFLGLDAPIKVDAHLDGDVSFTIVFDTPDGRIIDVGDVGDGADHEALELQAGVFEEDDDAAM